MSDPVKHLCGHEPKNLELEKEWDSNGAFCLSAKKQAKIEENPCPECHAKFFASDAFYESAYQSTTQWEAEIKEITSEMQHFGLDYFAAERLINLSTLIVLRYRAHLQKLVIANQE